MCEVVKTIRNRPSADSDGDSKTRDWEAVERLSTQVVSNTGERLISDVLARCMREQIVNACQEYEETNRSATAK